MTSWTPLSEADRQIFGKGRMGGGLLVMTIVWGFVTFCVFLLILAMMATMARTMLLGLPLPDLSDLGGGGARGATFMFAIPVGYFMIWATIVFIMTLVRARPTPAFASGAMMLQFVIGIGAWFAGQSVIFAQYDGGAGPTAMIMMMIPSMLPHWLMQIVMIAGFCGYMLGGVRSNAYFKRRVASISSARTEP